MGGRDTLELPGAAPSLDEYVRAIVREEVAKEVARRIQDRERSDLDEILTAKQIAAETKYSCGAINLWFRQNLVPGAYHNGRKGTWRVTRRGWNTFIETMRRRPLKRLRAAS